MAKVFVTGGAGFIGSHIVDALHAEGHAVQVIDDLSSGERSHLPAEVVLHEMDIRSAEAKALLAQEEPDILVHCAAQISVRVSMQEPVLDTEVNVVGLVNLLDAFRGKKLPHVVFLSTGGAIYGEQDTFPAGEDHPIRPTSIYGLAKRVGELYLDFWQREHGLKATILRLGNVYGPRQNPHGEAGVVAIFCQRLLAKQEPVIFGTGEQTRDFVYVKDVVRAVQAALGTGVQGTFNVGTGVETSVNELFAGVQRALDPSASVSYAEARAGEQQRSCIDPGRALQDLKWRPEVALTQGLQETADWFASHIG